MEIIIIIIIILIVLILLELLYYMDQTYHCTHLISKLFPVYEINHSLSDMNVQYLEQYYDIVTKNSPSYITKAKFRATYNSTYYHSLMTLLR